MPTYRAPPPPSPTPLPTPVKKAVHTVAFVMSDGDNIQLLQNDWISNVHWNHPLRGTVPAGWSYSPAMARLMPSVLSYVERTATSNDSLSTGPSGAGYCYPELFPQDLKRPFAAATAQLMQQSGMTVANVIGVTPSRESVSLLAAERAVEGIVYFTFGVASQGYAGLHGNVDYIAKTPVVGLRLNLWGQDPTGDKVSVDGLVRELRNLPKDTTDPQSYSVIVNELGNSFGEVVNATKQLQALGGFEVVLPEELLRRLATNTRTQAQCPLPSGRWASEAGNLPECFFNGDGKSCVFTCARLQGDLLRLPIKCDLRKCPDFESGANLTLVKGLKPRFYCAVSGKAC